MVAERQLHSKPSELELDGQAIVRRQIPMHRPMPAPCLTAYRQVKFRP
jgi:hypothetical protein